MSEMTAIKTVHFYTLQAARDKERRTVKEAEYTPVGYLKSDRSQFVLGRYSLSEKYFIGILERLYSEKKWQRPE